MQSPYVLSVENAIMGQCYENGEFQHISMDGTLRVFRRVKGQMGYQASAVEKEAQALPEHECKRNIITIMGPSGTCLGLPLVRDEGPDDIAMALRHMWPPQYLQSIVSVNTDAPSKELWRSLRAIMPALQVISLDPCASGNWLRNRILKAPDQGLSRFALHHEQAEQVQRGLHC